MSPKYDDHPLELDPRKFQMLALLYPDELHFMRSSSQLLEVAADVPIIEEGQRPSHLYFLQSGLLIVNKRYGNEVTEVGSITPGNLFGETGILYDAQAGAEVRSVEPSVLFQVPASQVRDILSANERFLRSLTQIAERRSAASALAVNPVFATLSQAVREIVLYNAQFISLEEGQVLFREGESDTRHIYLVLGGKAEASIRHPENPSKRIVVARISSGDEIGEVPVITGKGHSMTIVATSPLRLIAISSESVQAWRRRYSDFAYALYACVQRKLVHNYDALRALLGDQEAAVRTIGSLPPLEKAQPPAPAKASQN